MYRPRPDIFEMLDTLSLEMKEELLEYLKADIAAAKAAPKKSYLEEQWVEIKRLIETLKYEPYIDDQIEIDEIWEISEEYGSLYRRGWEDQPAAAHKMRFFPWLFHLLSSCAIAVFLTK